MAKQVFLKPSALRNLQKLPEDAQKALAEKVNLLAVDARAAGEKKLDGHNDLFRIRAGDYRAVYEKDGTTITVLLFGDRKNIYKMLRRLH
ncbi:MAG: type II toxin-antitoxin system RelE/ParE family toxin [Planctomycetota bacterium]|nr:type II toxin-antitoxin system RelE/ParE family toxin [Planctomycetota bacterium]